MHPAFCRFPLVSFPRCAAPVVAAFLVASFLLVPAPVQAEQNGEDPEQQSLSEHAQEYFEKTPPAEVE